MPIDYRISSDGDLVLAVASGVDFTVDDVKAYGMAVITACLKSGATRVLCDERQLMGQLDTLGDYEAAEFVAQHATRVVRVAIVCPAHLLGDRDFWETVAVNRGLRVRVFADIDLANTWLAETTSPMPATITG